MALVISNNGSLFNTTNSTNHAVAATTVTVGHLWVVVTISSASGSPSPTTAVNDNNPDGLGTYTKIVEATGGGTNGCVQIWVRNALIGNAGATTVTRTNGGDTGGGLQVFRVSGMTKVGAAAILQSVAENTQTESPPSISFPAAMQTGNGGITAILGEDSPPTLTAPTNWPESVDTGYSTPTTGIVTNSRNSTAGDQTLNWTGGALVDHCEVGVELDASSSANYALTSIKANAAFSGGSHTMAVGRVLAHTKANVTLAGGSHDLAVHSPNVTLTSIKGNITLNGGLHTMSVGRTLAAVAPTLTFTGTTDTAAVGRQLTSVKANITLTGTPDALAIGRSLSNTKGNIAFAGGSHTLTVTGGATHYTLTSIASNIAFLGRNHGLAYSGEPLGEPVRDPQATLVVVLAEARLVRAEGKAVLGN